MKATNTNIAASSASRRFSTQDVVLVGLFTAILAVISQISVPTPTGVPLTFQVFGVTLVGVILGWKLGLLTTVTYILLGAVGMPVFSGFRGGLDVLAGMAGGYVIAWPIMVIFCGIKPKTSNHKLNLLLSILFALIGLIIDEIAGGLQWAALAGDKNLSFIFTYSMVAFVPKDILITIMAVLVGRQVRKPLLRAGYMK